MTRVIRRNQSKRRTIPGLKSMGLFRYALSNKMTSVIFNIVQTGNTVNFTKHFSFQFISDRTLIECKYFVKPDFFVLLKNDFLTFHFFFNQEEVWLLPRLSISCITFYLCRCIHVYRCLFVTKKTLKISQFKCSRDFFQT